MMGRIIKDFVIKFMLSVLIQYFVTRDGRDGIPILKVEGCWSGHSWNITSSLLLPFDILPDFILWENIRKISVIVKRPKYTTSYF